MLRRMAYRDFYQIPVPCPECGEITPETVAWLVDHDKLVCGQCDVAVDLRLEEMRALIEDADKVCALIDGSIK